MPRCGHVEHMLQVSESTRRKAAEALPSPTRRVLQATNATSAVLNVQLNYLNNSDGSGYCERSPLGCILWWDGVVETSAPAQNTSDAAPTHRRLLVHQPDR